MVIGAKFLRCFWSPTFGMRTNSHVLKNLGHDIVGKYFLKDIQQILLPITP